MSSVLTDTTMLDIANLSTPIPSDNTLHYAGAKEIHDFSNIYKNIHGYLAVVVCVFGIIANILNIVVLSRKNMISPTNWILSGLAVSDGLTMAAYLPFALRFYCLYGTEQSPQRNTLAAIRYLLFFACFSVVVHTVSIWLTLTLAIWRFISIKFPRHSLYLCNLHRAEIAVILVYITTIIVCIPNFVTIAVQEDHSIANQTMWFVGFKFNTKLDQFVHDFNFWIQAILVKLLPCVGLTIISILIVREMNIVEARRQKLRSHNQPSGTVALQGKGRREDLGSRARNTNRTTRMLLTVVVLFLLTEFPQGILSLLSGILPHFVEEIYIPLGDIMDIFTLINNGINFILYCTMSKQFRDTFIEVFFTPLKGRARKFVPVTLITTAGDQATMNI